MKTIIWKREDAEIGQDPLTNGWWDLQDFIFQAADHSDITGRCELLLNGTGIKSKVDPLKYNSWLLKSAMLKIYNHLPVPRNHSVFLEMDVVKSKLIEVRFTPK